SCPLCGLFPRAMGGTRRRPPCVLYSIASARTRSSATRWRGALARRCETPEAATMRPVLSQQVDNSPPSTGLLRCLPSADRLRASRAFCEGAKFAIHIRKYQGFKSHRSALTRVAQDGRQERLETGLTVTAPTAERGVKAGRAECAARSRVSRRVRRMRSAFFQCASNAAVPSELIQHRQSQRRRTQLVEDGPMRWLRLRQTRRQDQQHPPSIQPANEPLVMLEKRPKQPACRLRDDVQKRHLIGR